MSNLEVGQVISLKIFYTNDHSACASINHPYLIYQIDSTKNTVEVIQLDKLKGKEHLALSKQVKVVFAQNPNETVIDQDSLANCDMKITIENDQYIERFRRQKEKLSSCQLSGVVLCYENYQRMFGVKPERITHMTISDIQSINR